MDSFKQRVHKQVDSLNEELSKYAVFRLVEDAAGIPKMYAALAVGIIMSCFLFFGLGAAMLCNVVGFVYPAYKSYQAIESDNTFGDDVQWLTYWVVFGFFNMIEAFLELLLHWFPFYYAFKMGFLIFCFMPGTRGSEFVYSNIIKPFFEQHGARVRVPAVGGRDLSGEAKKDK